jgi:hypothetical protein
LPYPKIGSFSSDFHNAATNSRCRLPLVWIKDADHDPLITPDIAHLLMTFDRIDQYVGSIGIDPGLGQLWRAIRHESRERADHALLQELLKVS